MKKILIACALMICASQVAKAQSYGLAGCGLGTMVFSDKQDKYSKMQILAATTNGTSGNQTFGITSGTSNCVDKKDSWASLYIESNFETIKNDVARGEGETINNLAKIYNCNDVTSFSNALKSNYETLFQNNNPVETKEEVRSLAQTLNCKIS